MDAGRARPILTVGAAEVCANSHQPLSRIDEREARRRTHRRSPVKRAGRRVAVRLQRRADASRDQMRSARELAARAVRRAAVALRGTAVHVAERAADVATRLRPVMHRVAAGAGERWRRVSNMAERLWPAARQGSHAAHAVVVRAWSRGVAAAMPASPRPFTAFERQELGGFVVALVLSVAVAGYGALLVMFWGDRVEYPVARAAAVLPVPAAPVPTTPSLVEPVAGQPAIVDAPAIGRPSVEPVAVVERLPSVPTARTLTALWQRRDTRSLDRAFTMLRQETLAFRNCGVRMTGADRAVARCQGSGRLWTIDFQRRAGRWAMTRVDSR
jgi:hypothetical protein